MPENNKKQGMLVQETGGKGGFGIDPGPGARFRNIPLELSWWVKGKLGISQAVESEVPAPLFFGT